MGVESQFPSLPVSIMIQKRSDFCFGSLLVAVMFILFLNEVGFFGKYPGYCILMIVLAVTVLFL